MADVPRGTMIDLITKKPVRIRWQDKCCGVAMGRKSYTFDKFTGKIFLIIACANCNNNFTIIRKIERRGKDKNDKDSKGTIDTPKGTRTQSGI